MENSQTIGEVKKYLTDNWRKGVDCPCCKQKVQLYRYKIQAQMIYYLFEIMKLQRNKPWVHVMNEVKPINGDYAKLRYWGLIEERGDVPEKDTKSSGFWRITEKGKQFLYGYIPIYSHCLIFNHKCYGTSGVPITVQEALQNKFSYEELMNG